MGAHQNIDISRLHSFDNIFEIFGRLEAGDHLYRVRPVGKTIAKVGVMLISQ